MNTDSKKLVSVIITTYNRSEFIEESFQSVFCQDYNNIEIIVVDDASDDSQTVDEIQSVISQSPFHSEVVILTRNRGPGNAREIGRKLAKGDYIQYFDSDDLLISDKISRQVNALESHPNLDVAYGKTLFFSGKLPKDLSSIENQIYHQTDTRFDVLLNALLKGRLWAGLTPLYRAGFLQKVGPWLPLYVNEDVEYEFRVALQSAGMFYDPEPVGLVRHHSNRLVEKISTDVGNYRDRVTAFAAIASGLQERSEIDVDFNVHPDFALNLFFLARKAALIGEKTSMDTLLKSFRQTENLPARQIKRERWFSLVSKLFGVRSAGKINEILESIL